MEVGLSVYKLRMLIAIETVCGISTYYAIISVVSSTPAECLKK